MVSNLPQVTQRINTEQSECSASDRTPEPFPMAFSSRVLLWESCYRQDGQPEPRPVGVWDCGCQLQGGESWGWGEGVRVRKGSQTRETKKMGSFCEYCVCSSPYSPPLQLQPLNPFHRWDNRASEFRPLS